MKRKVLLIEPDYKNKYPPMGLMKLATYFRDRRHDDVRFFKGDLKQFAAQLLFEEYYAELIELGAFRAEWQYHVKRRLWRRKEICSALFKVCKLIPRPQCVSFKLKAML